MKTYRLYYHDACLTTFTARIIERLTCQGRPAVVLDQTAFYPTGGGQPHDLGHLNDVPVVEVFERDRPADGAVVHVLAADLTGEQVTGAIDWARRFDHMQQHTGQHILSQAFVQVADAETVGFHLSQDTLTIDLNRVSIPWPVIEQVEDLANQIVFQDRPVTVHLVTLDELERLPLRKLPKMEENIRLVQVEGFDWSPCGGTHVARTGQVGLIKIIGLERRGAETRVTFCCGGRALTDYRRKHDVLARTATGLSVGYWELEQAVARLQAESKETHKKWTEAETRLMDYEAGDLIASAQEVGDFALVVCAWPDRDMNSLRLLAKKIAEHPRTVALLGSGGRERSSLVFARSPDVNVDVADWLRQAAVRLGGKGGGQSNLAQGGGGPAGVEQVQAALEWIAGQYARNRS